MPLLIDDANIFIDFKEGGILEELFEIEDTIGVPDFLYEAELKDMHSHLLDLGLALMELASETIARAAQLVSVYRQPSRLDITALALAEQESCPLLTGDMDLRLEFRHFPYCGKPCAAGAASSASFFYSPYLQ
jgi:hypothetical protein